MMTNDEIKRFQSRCRSYARWKRRPEHADDFAQEAIICVLRGRKATIDQLYVDYLRREFSQTHSPYGKLKASAMHSWVSLDSPCFEDDSKTFVDVIADTDVEHTSSPSTSHFELTMREELIASMIVHEGMKQPEIEKTLNIGRNELRKNLKMLYKISKDEEALRTLNSYKYGHIDTSLSVDWIQL